MGSVDGVQGQVTLNPDGTIVFTIDSAFTGAAGFSGCSSMAEQKLPKQLAGFLMSTVPSHKWRISALSSYPPFS